MNVTSYTHVTSSIYNTPWMKKIILASLKPGQGKTLWGKKLAREKEHSILRSLRVLLDCLIKTLQRIILWEKTLAKEKKKSTSSTYPLENLPLS